MYTPIMTTFAKYQLHRLDGRHSHNQRYRYYLEFSASMSNRSGPLHFNNAMAWCIKTWGWSAEVNQTARMLSWVKQSTVLGFPNIMTMAGGILEDLPDHCNLCWSWSNKLQPGLRIYLRSDAELAFFQLAHAVDQ